MPRPVTKRSLDASRIKAPQLPEYPEAFARLLKSRNNGAPRRLYLRDLHEEAIAELLRELEQGAKIHFLATPTSGYLYSDLAIDRSLRDQAAAAAKDRKVRFTTLVFTAFGRYLEKQGLLEAA